MYGRMGEKTMKIIISKTMVKALNAAAAALNMPHRFTYCETGYNEYRQLINMFGYGHLSGHDITRDNKIKYISVSYPDNYYAIDQYITFDDLDRAFMAGDTVETFTNRIVEWYEI